MTQTILVGDIGSGKTLMLSVLASASDRKVYANFNLNLPNAERIKVFGLDELEDDCDIFLDEIHMEADSRIATSIANRYKSYEALQQRKDTADIYGSTQFFHMIDNRLRDLTHVVVKCTCIGDRYDPEGFYYEFLDVASGVIDELYLPIENARQFFDIYDTKEKINPAKKQFYILQRLKSEDSPAFMKRCEEIAFEIKPLMSKITKDETTNVLLENNYPAFIMSQVYFYLKKFPDHEDQALTKN